MVLVIDRMEIDDVGANPKKLAEAITKQLEKKTGAIPVRDIAKAIDIDEIREENLEGLEGALIVSPNKDCGKIVVRIDRREEQKRFTIAHELGHYVNPTHRESSPNGFRCSRDDMQVLQAKPNSRHEKMELEANRFAAELLMPEDRVKAFMRLKRGADLEHIIELAKYFEVSKEAAARKYLTQLDKPAAMIFSCEGKVRYFVSGEGFPRLAVRGGDAISIECLSGFSKAQIGEVTNIVETPAHLWLERSSGLSLGEQTVGQRNGFRMTLLTVEELEADETEWSAPKFRG